MQWVDAARGIAIIAVVWIHARSGVEYADWSFDYWVVLRQFLNFAVALFLFLSGFLVDPDRIARAGEWTKHRAVRLLLPFIIWSTVYFAVVAWRDGSVGDLLTVVPRLVLGRSAAHLYFIVVLAQLVVLTPLLARALHSRGWWALLLVTPAYFTVRYVVFATSGGATNIPMFGYSFAGWLIFYYLGMWARTNPVPSLRSAIVTVTAAAIVSIAEAFTMLGGGGPPALRPHNSSFLRCCTRSLSSHSSSR